MNEFAGLLIWFNFRLVFLQLCMLGTAINELPPFGKDITRLANNELTLFVWHKAPLEVYPPALVRDFLSFVYKNLSNCN